MRTGFALLGVVLQWLFWPDMPGLPLWAIFTLAGVAGIALGVSGLPHWLTSAAPVPIALALVRVNFKRAG